ncbi:hypothetical protein NHX12_009759, partial [Muraenolepis orangiensis]
MRFVTVVTGVSQSGPPDPTARASDQASAHSCQHVHDPNTPAAPGLAHVTVPTQAAVIRATPPRGCQLSLKLPGADRQTQSVSLSQIKCAKLRSYLKEIGERAEDLSGASSSVLSVSSASDLSISLTESEPEDDPAEDGVSCRAPRASSSPARQASSPGRSDESLQSSADGSRSYADSPPTERTAERLTREGLFHLLESIEGQLWDERSDVYSASAIDDGELAAIISLCNRRAPGASHEDLEARSAVVLQELQRLSWSTERGCLLPWDLVQDQPGSSPQPGDIRQPDSQVCERTVFTIGSPLLLLCPTA